MASSDWYRDPNAVLEQIRLAGASRGGIPSIAGYDDLVEIKRGGQGVVYSATQRSTRRRVAIKLLLDGAFANDTARRRFEREVDLVAGLRHPNIVRIFDSGLSSEGRPYFVMEYVDGLPLDQHVSNAKPSSMTMGSAGDGAGRFEQVLKPVLAVCDAVQHAHQHGVIHRDLKPANIRVDSDGLPRVLDFGLARDVAGDPGASLDLTQSGHFLGSLAWASPEHASGKPDAIDTRSDVYSLGVILYFLLTGKHPLPIDGSPRDVLDGILRTEPPSPSHWNDRIDADLSTIVLKCLAKEPQRRYQSVGALADDIRHYLAGEPIQARRDSMWYTLRKQARRYKVIAIAAGVVVVVIAAALAVSLNLWRSADRERKNATAAQATAQAQRDIAERRGRQTAAVNDVLKNILSSADPARKGRDVRVVDLLERAAADAKRLESTQPEVAVPVRFAIGRSYLTLGLFSEARTQVDAGLTLGADQLGADANELIDGQMLNAEVLLRLGKMPEAESAAHFALDHFGTTRGPDDLNTIDATHVLSTVLAGRGQFAEAADLARQAIAARSRLLGARNPQTLESMNHLAGCLRRLGRLDESQALYEQVLEQRRTVTGDERSDVINTMSDLASLLSDRDQHARAIELFDEAVTLADKTYGAEHPRTLIIRSNLATAQVRVKRTDEAIANLRQVLEVERRVLEPDNPSRLATLSNLASAYKAAGRLDEALPLIKEAADAAPGILGPNHPNTLIYINNYGTNLMNAKRLVEAEAIFRQVYTSAFEKLGEANLLTATFRGNLGRAISLQKRYDEAEPHLLDAYQRQVTILGATNERSRLAAIDLAEMYEGWGKSEPAADYRRRGEPPDAAPTTVGADH